MGAHGSITLSTSHTSRIYFTVAPLFLWLQLLCWLGTGAPESQVRGVPMNVGWGKSKSAFSTVILAGPVCCCASAF